MQTRNFCGIFAQAVFLCYNFFMTALEQRMYKNIADWRKLPKAEQRKIRHSSVMSRVVNSMAMEGEPVSEEWIRKNSR